MVPNLLGNWASFALWSAAVSFQREIPACNAVTLKLPKPAQSPNSALPQPATHRASRASKPGLAGPKPGSLSESAMFLRQCASNFGRGKSLRFSHILKKKVPIQDKKRKRKSPPKTIEFSSPNPLRQSIEKLSERVLGSNFVQRLLFVTSKNQGNQLIKSIGLGPKPIPRTSRITEERKKKKKIHHCLVSGVKKNFFSLSILFHQLFSFLFLCLLSTHSFISSSLTIL